MTRREADAIEMVVPPEQDWPDRIQEGIAEEMAQERRSAREIELSGVEPFYQDVLREPTNEELERLEAFNTIYNLVSQYGSKRVATWVLNAARFQEEHA